MNSSFVYSIPTKVYFGENQLQHLGKELRNYGTKVLLVYGGGSIKKNGLYDKIRKEIADSGLELFEYSGIEPNPRHTSVNEGAEICKRENIDVLLAVGGGSVIDATKFIGAGAYYNGDVWDLVTRKAPITHCLPIITILTLAATGSEMNAGGVITNLDTKDKIGMGAACMLPKVSFLDPTVTYSVDRYQTSCGCADIFSHVVEVYFSMDKDLSMLDSFMEGLMKTVIHYAPIAMEHPNDYEARANLMWASSWAINGFINGGKTHAWSCHPMEHELSAYYDMTHGLGLAILIPRWMKYTLNENTVSRFEQYGRNVFDIHNDSDPMVIANKAIHMTSEFFFKTLGLKSNLSELGIDESKFEIMAKKAAQNGTFRAFVPLDAEDIVNIYQLCK
ncbi:MAG: iron-containing alcohol dehydrogenase [Clostridiales bacterium]|nr:iron-containing alcohol dehydrogenase [Clostridiales bacterium]